jgi:hypothetical protein
MSYFIIFGFLVWISWSYQLRILKNFFQQNRKILNGLFFSTIWHFILLLMISQLSQLFLTHHSQDKLEKNSITVDTINQQELQQLKQQWRKVGIKNGKKNDQEFFQGQVKKKIDLSNLAIKPGSTKTPPVDKIENSQNLNPTNALTGNQKVSSARATYNNRISKQLQNNATSNKPFQMMIKEELAHISTDSKNDSDLLTILNNTDLQLRLDPPEGVSVDELNQLESIFFGFNQRAMAKFIQTIFNEYLKMDRKSPFFMRQLKIKNESMLGKVTFDQNGDIIKINFLRSSDLEPVQVLFENTLQSMQKLQNPPKDLIKNGEFSIFYQLIIKG